jgi:lipopolysaccharide/colanic/teichoic acid biosynthesis glycosyltransferase|tara:strand:- start:7162 stop:8493 length:1332 start_codon:yes stop_codon:yes gene_type:complete
MITERKKEGILLFLGDILFFTAALWVTLTLRYFEVPSGLAFYDHLIPFSLLFLVWVTVFFIAGLYDKHTIIFKRKLPSIILNAQIVNVILAAVFFFFIPYFGITPKTNLFIYLFISFIFIVTWRLYLFPLLGSRKRQNALLIASGSEMLKLRDEINNNARYNFYFTSSLDLDTVDRKDLEEYLYEHVKANNISIIVADTSSEKVSSVIPILYHLTFIQSRFKFLDFQKMYENIFDCVPLSLVKYNWFLNNVSWLPRITHDLAKRFIDIVFSVVLGIPSLLVYPFVVAAVKFGDKGPVFIIQERIGKDNRPIYIFKFRSMSIYEKEKVTRVGNMLRKTRIDEFPQLWNVLKGDLSLIGPRPEMPHLAELYEKEIPYYNIRHFIQPGLSGWAQIHHSKPPKFGAQYDGTKEKLSYDIFYIKNRSLLLDLYIGLKTIKTLFSRTGL